MKIFAIDPGPLESAWCQLDTETDLIDTFKEPNILVRERLVVARSQGDKIVIEMVKSYNQRVGQEVFETCVWIGRFLEAAEKILDPTVGWGNPNNITLIGRKEYVVHHCLSTKGADQAVRAAMIERFGAPGTKKNPGGTYGVKADEWQALGLAAYLKDRIDRLGF